MTDDPIYLLPPWPLLLLIEDCYIPLIAPAVVRTVEEASSETLTKCFDWAAKAAVANLGARVN